MSVQGMNHFTVLSDDHTGHQVEVSSAPAGGRTSRVPNKQGCPIQAEPVVMIHIWFLHWNPFYLGQSMFPAVV